MRVQTLIDQYTDCLKTEGKSAYTVRWHQASLRQFAGWLDANDHPHDPDKWSAPLLRRYIAWQRERPSLRHHDRPLSDSALNSLIRSLRAFCTWLHEEEWTHKNAFAKVTVPKAPRLAKPTLTVDEVHTLIAAARENKRHALRDEAMILFLLDTGCRANEVCTLAYDSIDWERRIARVYGKGAKERYVPFSYPTAKAMRKYAIKQRNESCDRFFQSEEGTPLTVSGMGQIFMRLGRRTGIKANPHKFRHSFSIQYLRNGGSVFALQKTLGHRSLDTTLRYAQLMTDDLVDAHHAHSPVNALYRRKPS